MRYFDLKKWYSRESYTSEPSNPSRVEQNNEIESHWYQIWFENAKENWKHAEDGRWINISMYGMKRGNVILCGAGPSLESNIQYLSLARKGGSYIIAVDSTYQTMKEHGIVPDLVVCADAQIEVADFIRDIDPRTRVAINLVCHPSVYEAAYKAGCRIYWYGICNPESDFWREAMAMYGENIACVRGFGTVFVCAADIAIWMGFDSIVSVGNECGWPNQEEADKSGNTSTITCDGNDWVTIGAYATTARACALLASFHPDVDFRDISGGMTKIGWRESRFATKEVSA